MVFCFVLFSLFVAVVFFHFAPVKWKLCAKSTLHRRKHLPSLGGKNPQETEMSARGCSDKPSLKSSVVPSPTTLVQGQLDILFTSLVGKGLFDTNGKNLETVTGRDSLMRSGVHFSMIEHREWVALLYSYVLTGTMITLLGIWTLLCGTCCIIS